MNFISKNMQKHIYAISSNTKQLNGAKFKESTEFCKQRVQNNINILKESVLKFTHIYN